MEIREHKFIKLINKFRQIDLVKVFSFNAISTVVKMLTGLISVKFVALIVGPSGIALLGQLNNFSSIIMTVACGGINNGVTKYVAESKQDLTLVKSFLSTALKITVYCSVLCGLFLVLFNKWLSKIILLNDDFGYIFIIFGITLLLYALNMLVASILNGYKEFKKYVLVNIAGSIIGLIYTLILVYYFKLNGALIGVVTFQSIMFFVSLWIIRKLTWVNIEYFKEKLNKLIAAKYFKYTLMTLVTAATAPVAQLLLRGYVINEISAVEAGWWEGMNRISNMYLMVITSSLSVYYLPKLSEIEEPVQLRVEVFRAYKFIIPTITFGFIAIYLFRILIIKLLFTADFFAMSDLFLWQLVGDFFKIMSWVLAFLMIAKTMTKQFIVSEIVFTLLYVGLGYWFVEHRGIIGLTQAWAANYFLYLVFMVYLFRKLLFGNVANIKF